MKITRVFLVSLALVIAASVALSAVCLAAKQAKPANMAEQPNWWGPPPPKPLPADVVRGVAGYVDANRIDVETRQGVRPFAVDGNTKVRVRGEKARITDVKKGDPVTVKFKPVANAVPYAVGVMVAKPSLPVFRGKITAIEGNVLTIADPRAKGEAKGVFRVTVPDSTPIMSHGYAGSFADLRMDYGVAARGQADGNNMTAVRIDFAPPMGKGTVTAVEGDVVTVKTVRQNVIACKVSPETSILIRPRVGPNKSGTLADIQVGMPADVGFHLTGNSPVQLLWIDLLTGM